MNSILKRLRKLANDELLALSEAIDLELELRLDRTEDVPDSARRRAIQRQQSDRQPRRSSPWASARPAKTAGRPERAGATPTGCTGGSNHGHPAWEKHANEKESKAEGAETSSAAEGASGRRASCNHQSRSGAPEA